ncbi:redoxin domain-containing protein [Candidatus Protochlamydia phocaeensis]|uniref:redoxin domain-containing protein n=1 Tax=Candidatus Protochlamydia phocaeensis TaxID=1414722 RepID=UPI0008386CA5|nr:redoxin domain-containing protein [Candidatus Protochlamydia phocaeensis]
MPALKAGTKAPQFRLPVAPDRHISLKDFKGQPVVLVFYPADWSPVCSSELALYNEIYADLKKDYNAELLGISVDGAWCHLAFADQRRLRFPLLADFEPKGEVAKLYGVYREDDGTSERALFVINQEGLIQWSSVSPIEINPGADGILNALDTLTKKTSILG